jgi:hypothetical protein
MISGTRGSFRLAGRAVNSHDAVRYFDQTYDTPRGQCTTPSSTSGHTRPTLPISSQACLAWLGRCMSGCRRIARRPRLVRTLYVLHATGAASRLYRIEKSSAKLTARGSSLRATSGSSGYTRRYGGEKEEHHGNAPASTICTHANEGMARDSIISSNGRLARFYCSSQVGGLKRVAPALFSHKGSACASSKCLH